jgi:hypothetical protein
VPKKIVLAFVGLGAFIALNVFAFGFLKNYGNFQNRSHTDDVLQKLSFTLCPPCLGLMVSDNHGSLMAAIVMAIIALENAALYGLRGAVILGFLNE